MRTRSAGPWHHRVLVWIFTLLLGLLTYWLLGFVIRDIGNLDGPNLQTLKEERVGNALPDRLASLDEEIVHTQRQISDAQAGQQLLRDSTANSQTTMNQLLELQRMRLEKEVAISEEEQSALLESQSLFLDSQRKYQELNAEVALLSERLKGLQSDRAETNRSLQLALEPVMEEYHRLASAHRWRVAAFKLGFLAPLMVIALFAYLRSRGSVFTPLAYAFGIAVIVKVLEVMHETFPRAYFKYILIALALLLVLRILVHLLRMVAFPKTDWLVKQYREAYEAFLCPICSYPIRRGPLKYMSWTRRSIRQTSVPLGDMSAPDEPYTCPGCATALYEPCEQCKAIRHSLLPACQSCGARLADK